MPPKGPNKATMDAIRKKQEQAKLIREQEEAFRREEEALKKAAEEEERLKAEAAAKKRLEKQQEIERLKSLGLYKTKKQKEEEEELARRREAALANFTFASPNAAQQKSKDKGESLTQVERMKLETERLKQEQQRLKQLAIEKFHTAEPQYITAVNTAKDNVASTQAKITAKKDEIKQIQVDLEVAENEEVLDDWDASDNDDDGESAESTALKAKLSEAEAELNTLENTTLPSLNTIVTEADKAYQTALDHFEKQLQKEEAAKKEQQRQDQIRQEEMSSQQHLSQDGEKSLRAPIVVILGHVDSGKTSLMDKIRNSTVAKGEAGGITQQIGSSYVPAETITAMCSKYKKTVLNKDTPEGAEEIPLAIEKHGLPGLLCIDTPGHESFSMLRERGGDICDVAILIVDIQQGLQQQTIESIQILQQRGTPFIIAVTKVDALYGWDKKEEHAWNPIQQSLAGANDIVMREFERAYDKAIAQFAQQEINVKLFWENDDPTQYNNLVPVSSKTGEGIPDLMQLLVEMTVGRMSERLSKQRPDPLDFRCIVLEVKHHEGYGATLDVVLANGTIREGDRIVCAGINGPIESVVKGLLLPPANKDQRVQKDYVQVRAVHAAMGFKIIAPDLQRVLAGSSLYVIPNDKYYDAICDKVQEDLSSVICDIDMDRRGVFLHASSLGSLEALITLLKHEKIPISGFDIGTVHKASVTMAATQLAKQKPEYALILAFDVKVDPAAQKEADSAGVAIFAEDVIYHLHDKAVAHFQKVRDDHRSTHKPVFPCSLKFSKEGTRNRIFHSSDPILIGVIVTQGTLHVGTPLISFFPNKTIHLMNLGTVLSIKSGNDFLKSATKDQEVSITIGRGNLSTKPELTEKNTQPDKNLEVQFLSKMSGFDADFLLENFKEELTDDDVKLISAFKKLKLI